ncbi:D-aminoacyl-tRNA deacylase [Crocinitomix algicola]|uniref:D-aminoacyl-tRNA deacylase n=1 Tax=Crocinitomix algicola TaxID=1740263 RepID=UPI00082D09A4|nr:D-aminoacyl-tRNA deacylase [Crocinitomix algicola]
MRIIIQRVSKASVSVDSNLISSIENGYLLLVGIGESDTEEDIEWLSKKITNLRIFSDEKGQMNHSIIDIDGEILAISQFTLFAKTKKGNRPSFIKAAPPNIALPLYDLFVDSLNKLLNKPVQKGVFGAHMEVSLINDGPVTIFIDSKNRE